MEEKPRNPQTNGMHSTNGPIDIENVEILALKEMKNKVAEALDSQSKTQPIKWNEYNFPPLCKLVHFRLDELPYPHKAFVRLLFISFMLLPVILVINLVINILETAYGKNGFRILYSVLFSLILIPLEFFTFFKGYRGVAADLSVLRWYKILRVALIFVYIFYSILDVLGSNGIIQTVNLFKEELNVVAALSIFEWVAWIGYIVFNTFLFFRSLCWNEDPVP